MRAIEKLKEGYGTDPQKENKKEPMPTIDKYIEEFEKNYVWKDGEYRHEPKILKEWLSHALQTYGEDMKADAEAQGIRRAMEAVDEYELKFIGVAGWRKSKFVADKIKEALQALLPPNE